MFKNPWAGIWNTSKRADLTKKNTSGWHTKFFVIRPNEGGAHGLDCIELFLLNIYMLYSGFSDYMLWGWGWIDPPVKVGGCGGAFWTMRTLQPVAPSLSQMNLAGNGHKITNITKNSETTMKNSRVTCILRVNFLECARCTHSFNQTMGYRKISRDLKECAIFLLDHPKICDNTCEVLGILPASLNCQILLLSTMIVLIIRIHG